MDTEKLRKILRGKCISDASCEAAINEIMEAEIVLSPGEYEGQIEYKVSPNGWTLQSVTMQDRKGDKVTKHDLIPVNKLLNIQRYDISIIDNVISPYEYNTGDWVQWYDIENILNDK